ncbi:MAG: hypothetical protein LBS65_04345 [Desulfovibrio sp.]|jgi:hypothetical protein|nr:hypothetical protein [Desulfovibrio sp.]
MDIGSGSGRFMAVTFKMLARRQAKPSHAKLHSNGFECKTPKFLKNRRILVFKNLRAAASPPLSQFAFYRKEIGIKNRSGFFKYTRTRVDFLYGKRRAFAGAPLQVGGGGYFLASGTMSPFMVSWLTRTRR